MLLTTTGISLILALYLAPSSFLLLYCDVALGAKPGRLHTRYPWTVKGLDGEDLTLD